MGKGRLIPLFSDGAIILVFESILFPELVGVHSQLMVKSQFIPSFGKGIAFDRCELPIVWKIIDN